jgi:hypothetical protein
MIFVALSQSSAKGDAGEQIQIKTRQNASKIVFLMLVDRSQPSVIQVMCIADSDLAEDLQGMQRV